MAKTPTDIRALARQHTALAIRTLVGIASQRTAPHSARVAAATSLLDRGWGKPKVEVISDESGYVQALRAVAAELDERPDNRLV